MLWGVFKRNRVPGSHDECLELVTSKREADSSKAARYLNEEGVYYIMKIDREMPFKTLHDLGVIKVFLKMKDVEKRKYIAEYLCGVVD